MSQEAEPDYLNLLPGLTGATALDVATGGGMLARALARRFQAVVAVDLPEVLARTTPEGPPAITWAGMDAEALDLPDDTFDAAVVAWSLHHFRDPRRVLREMRRVVRPGGRLIVIEPVLVWTGTRRDHHMRAHVLGAHLDRSRGVWHQGVFARQQVEELVGALGLAAVESVLDLAPTLDDDDPAEGAPWAAYMDRTAASPDVEPLVRAEAARLAAAIRQEGLAGSPHVVVHGLKPTARP